MTRKAWNELSLKKQDFFGDVIHPPNSQYCLAECFGCPTKIHWYLGKTNRKTLNICDRSTQQMIDLHRQRHCFDPMVSDE